MDYDYIIVGSGAGGGPLAARLVEAGFSVLLLEAGADDQGVLEQVPAFHASASEDERISWGFFVRHYADEAQSQRDWKYIPCADEPERGGVFYPRAATLGGCTQHHAMIIVRPHNSDWDGIAAITGDPSWAAVRMQRYFQRLERCEYRPFQRLLHRLLGWSPSGHGFDGWLPTTLADPKLVIGDKQIAEIIIDSARYALGHTRSRLSSWVSRLLQTLFTRADPNDWRSVKHLRVGVRKVPLSVTGRRRTGVAGGRRTGVPERLRQVKAEHPGRLSIRTNVLVTRVLFEPDAPDAAGAAIRAVGVEYLDAAHLYGADPLRRGQSADVPPQLMYPSSG
jgi:choline dehydrogenase